MAKICNQARNRRIDAKNEIRRQLTELVESQKLEQTEEQEEYQKDREFFANYDAARIESQNRELDLQVEDSSYSPFNDYLEYHQSFV